MENFLCLVLFPILLSACSKETDAPSPTPSAPPTAQAAAPAQAADPVALIKATLGPDAGVATGRAVTELRGDFNGDQMDDQLLVVKADGKISELPSNVRVVRPWPLNDGETAGDTLSHGASVNLAVVHGTANGAQQQVFALHDDNSVSILDAPAAETISAVKLKDVSSLNEPKLAAAAKGDLLVVPTEAGIDTYVYWDGATYKVFAPEEEP